jgi:hypothetical protein
MLARGWFNSLLAAALRFSWCGFDLCSGRFDLVSYEIPSCGVRHFLPRAAWPGGVAAVSGSGAQYRELLDMVETCSLAEFYPACALDQSCVSSVLRFYLRPSLLESCFPVMCSLFLLAVYRCRILSPPC